MKYLTLCRIRTQLSIQSFGEQGGIGKMYTETGVLSNIFIFSKHAVLVLRVYPNNIVSKGNSSKYCCMMETY